MSDEISEEAIKGALKALSWDALAAHLESVNLDDSQIEKLLGLVKRSEALVQKRTAPKQEAKRDKLLESLADFLDQHKRAEAATHVRSYADMFRMIDGCYQGILDELKECDAASFSPEKRVSALLARSNHEYADLLKRGNDAVERGEIHFGQVTLKNAEGKDFNVAAVHSALVDALGSTIGMEAHLNKWFDSEGIVVLPSLPDTIDEDHYAVGTAQVLAISWRNWQRAERRHRYLDGVLREHTQGLGPNLVEMGVSRLIEALPSSELDRYDFIANARLDERFKQHLLDLSSKGDLRSLFVGVEGVASLTPQQTVSVWEMHGATSLSQLLAHDVTSDFEEFAGLRIIEWVRGYAVLQAIAEACRDFDKPESMSIRFSRSDLVARLQRLGLAGPKASLFIDHVTFRRESRDLFDQPLLRLQDGSLVLVGLAAGNCSIPRAVLSTLGMLNINLDGKGSRFESYVIRTLKRLGHEAKGIRCKRAGEEYDYDVAFVWGDYLFLLECKCRSLSGNDPIGAYYFSLGINSVVGQVKRLAEGLRKHPDILVEYMPEAVGKQVVFCVLNSLPYALIGGIDGIHFIDESSLMRFFMLPKFGSRKLDPKSGYGDIEPGTLLASLWRSESPTPEDLIRHLENPIQVVISNGHVEQSPAWNLLGKGTMGALIEYGQVDMTPESMRAALDAGGFRAPANEAQGQ